MESGDGRSRDRDDTEEERESRCCCLLYGGEGKGRSCCPDECFELQLERACCIGDLMSGGELELQICLVDEVTR